MTVLDRLASFARTRVELAKQRESLEITSRRALDAPPGDFGFENALKGPQISFICECKKASPSKGVIAEHFPYLEIAKEYEAAGADCVSVLTEPKWFLGSDQFLKEIASEISIPCLRKDFVVDPYMIYEAKNLGASAVLLICAILNEQELRSDLELCDRLGLSALVETRNEDEIKTAVDLGASMIGVNNRNLDDFSVDVERSQRLRELVPPNILFISESGARERADIEKLRQFNVDAVLIGEAMMKAPDKKAKLQELRGNA